MDDDFEGGLHDVAREELDSGAESGGESEADEALDQQMGDTGTEGETVDERLWGEEDKPQGKEVRDWRGGHGHSSLGKQCIHLMVLLVCRDSVCLIAKQHG